MTAPIQKRRALVVEDERPISELLRLHLELGGFAVAEVADGTRALELATVTGSAAAGMTAALTVAI